MFSDRFTASFLYRVKEFFLNRLIFGEDMYKSMLSVSFGWLTAYIQAPGLTTVIIINLKFPGHTSDVDDRVLDLVTIVLL